MVYDYIFKGWNLPMIGAFVVPIGKLMLELQSERQQELQKISEIIGKLESMMAMNDIQNLDDSFISSANSLRESENNINFSE